MKLSEDISGESPQAAWMQNTKLLEQLEGEITELQEKSTELEQLLQTEDNLLFLQVGADVEHQQKCVFAPVNSSFDSVLSLQRFLHP